MTDRAQLADDVRAALLLVGGLGRLHRGLPDADRADATRITQAISRRLYKTLCVLEPRRQALAFR